MDFRWEGNNYYSFRIIIRINKIIKKQKTSNTSSRDFTLLQHKHRNPKYPR